MEVRLRCATPLSLKVSKTMIMGDCQNYGPFLGPYYNTGPNTGPNLGDPKRDHDFDNLTHGFYSNFSGWV